MNRWILNSIGVSIIVALSLTVWGGFGLCHHLIAAVDSYQAAPTLSKLNAALDTINRPCGGGHPCGTLANADKAMVKGGDILVTSQYQEKDVALAAEHDMGAVDGLAAHLNGTADALTGTANGATESLRAATVDLQTANGAIAAAKPLLVDADTAIRSANTQINSPYIADFEKHVDGMSASGDSMLADAAWKTHQLLHPDKVKLGFWGSADAVAMWIHSHVLPPIF